MWTKSTSGWTASGCTFGWRSNPLRHQKYLNNRTQGDHSALTKLLNPMRGFITLRTTKAMLQGIEAIRTIKNNHIHQSKSVPVGEIEHLHKLFGMAA